MELVKVRGLVVKSMDYRDNDKLVTLVTFEKGKIIALARGVKKATAKLKYAAEMFNFGEYMIATKGEQFTITECVQIDSFSSLTQNIETYYCACMMMDALNKIQNYESQSDLLTYTIKLLGELSYSNIDPNIVSTEFLKGCLKYNGYELDFNFCSNCGNALFEEAYFSESNGIICTNCSNKKTDIPININVLRYLQTGIGDNDFVKRGNSYLSYILNEFLGIKINPMYFGDISYGE